MQQPLEHPIDLPEPVAGVSRLALKPEEAAFAIGASRRTIYNWMNHHGLPYFELGDRARRVLVADLVAFVEARREGEIASRQAET